MFTSKQIANTYDQIGLDFSATRPHLSAQDISFLPHFKPNTSVLDLGCGNGVLLTSLPDSINYLGIDISPVLISEAQKLHPHQRFLVADITDTKTWQDLPQFDQIVALSVFHHLSSPIEQTKLLQNIKQHIKPADSAGKPQGSISLSVWDLSSPRFDSFRTSQKHLSIPFHSGICRDFYAFTIQELISLMDQASFSNIKTTTTKNNLYLSASL